MFAASANAPKKLTRSATASASTLDAIKKKLKAAAYDNGGVNWHRLFKVHDHAGTGDISLEGFRSVIRKDARITTDVLTEDQLTALCKHVDKDGDGSVSYETEFLPWLDPTGENLRISTNIQDGNGKWGNLKDFMHAVHGISHGVAAAKAEIRKKKDLVKKQAHLESIHVIKKKLKIAASQNGKVNWKRLFRQYDRDNSGEINFDEFRSAIRKDAKVTQEMLSEYKLKVLFKHIDADNSGEVDYKHEFIPWLEEEEQEYEQGIEETRRMKEIEGNMSRHYKIEEIALLSKANQSYNRSRICLPFLIRWMNNLLVLRSDEEDSDRRRMTPLNFMDELKDGIHLLQIVRTLDPGAEFGHGIYNRCYGSRPRCESNLEKALAAASRHGLNMAHLCPPSDFYEGRVLQIARCLLCLFESLQMRPVRRRLKTMLSEMNHILAPLGRPLLEQTLDTPLTSEYYVLTDFEDCTRIMALLVIRNHAKPADMAKMYGNPKTEEQFLENANVLVEVLIAQDLPVLLLENEWCAPPFWNFDFLFLQLYELWKNLNPLGNRHDFANFKFKDGAPLRLSQQDLRASAEKASVAARNAKDAEAGVVPSSKLSKLFARFVDDVGGLEALWKKMDPQNTGSVSRKEFNYKLIALDFKQNSKRVFDAVDVTGREAISKEELKAFIVLSELPPSYDAGLQQRDIAKPKANKPGGGGIPPKMLAIPPKMLAKKHRDTIASNDVLEFVALVRNLGGVERAFAEFNVIGKGTLTMVEFQSAARRLGLRGDAVRVFKQLDLNRNATIDDREFSHLMHAFGEGRFEDETNLLECLLDVPDVSGIWPEPAIQQFMLEEELGDARFPGPAEEQNALFQEDLRRLREVAASGASSMSQKVAAAATEAAAAVGDMPPPDDTANLEDHLGNLLIQAEMSPGSAAAVGPQPTASLDARVVLADHSEKCMWLQTSVVDRTGSGSDDIDNATFVLEFRDQRHINSLLHAQIEVSMIISIEQLGPASNSSDASANVSFVITASPDADLGGSVVEHENDSELWKVCHVGPRGFLQLYVVAGPSPWKRREATQFFDELRIMVHFLGSASESSQAPQGHMPSGHGATQAPVVGRVGGARLSTLMGR